MPARMAPTSPSTCGCSVRRAARSAGNLGRMRAGASIAPPSSTRSNAVVSPAISASRRVSSAGQSVMAPLAGFEDDDADDEQKRAGHHRVEQGGDNDVEVVIQPPWPRRPRQPREEGTEGNKPEAKRYDH